MILTGTAERTGPLFGNVFPGGTGDDALVGVSEFGVVNMTAGVTDVLHNQTLLSSSRMRLSYIRLVANIRPPYCSSSPNQTHDVGL